MQVCHVSFGERDHPHIGERKALEEAGNVFLIARQPIHCFRENDVEASTKRVCDQRLDAGPQQGGAGDCLVGVFLDDLPALLLGIDPANAELVDDRRVTLIVGRIAGVEGDLHWTALLESQERPARRSSIVFSYHCRAARRASSRTNSTSRGSGPSAGMAFGSGSVTGTTGRSPLGGLCSMAPSVAKITSFGAKIGGNASPGNSVVRRKTGGARQVIAQAFAGTPSLSQSSVAQRPMRFGSANAR